MMRPQEVLPLLLLLLLVLVAQTAWSSEARERRVFSANSNPSYGSKQNTYALSSFRYEECAHKPKVPNAKVRCSFSGCRIQCKSGYKLNTGRVSTVVPCDYKTGQLVYNSQPWTLSLTTCLPQCGKEGCQNGGECLAPRRCQCADHYSGDHCQQRDTPACPTPQFQVTEAVLSWNDTHMKVTCNQGFAFPNGAHIVDIPCTGGVWPVAPGSFNPGGQLVCLTECNPPCQNGGTCIRNGVCNCPRGYWGSLCRIQRCSIPRHGLAHSSLGGNPTSRMKIECHHGYQMSSGYRWLTILCQGGEWTIPNKGRLQDNDVNCYPVCDPPCEHGGVCEAPGKCTCPPGYKGDHC